MLVGWLAWRSLGWPLVHDAPLMHYVARRIAEGAVPYRDLFDMNFPGVYLLHLLVVRALGGGDLAWRLFDLAWLASAAVAAAAFAAPWGRLAAAVAAGSLMLYHLAGGAWQAGQRDFLLCPLLLAGALGVARWLEATGGRRRRDLAWGGLALGASMTVKPHTAVLAAALGVMIAVTAWRAGSGMAGPLASFSSARRWCRPPWCCGLRWPAPCRRGGRSSSSTSCRSIPASGGPRPNVYRAWIWIPIASGVVLSAASALAAGRFRARHAVAAIGILYGLVHFVAQGKGWEYHLYPLAAFALAAADCRDRAGAGPARPPGGGAAAAERHAHARIAHGQGAGGEPGRVERAKAESAGRLAAELAPRLRPGDTVQVLDTTGGGIHALLRLGVREPTRFLYDFHFFHDASHPVIRALRAELIQGLDAHPPRLIVVFEQGWPAGGWERLDGFPELRERLARYDLVRPGPDYRIYAQRDR